MQTRYARQIREAIHKARHRNGPDWTWATICTNKLQYRAFRYAVLSEHRKDVLREIKAYKEKALARRRFEQ